MIEIDKNVASYVDKFINILQKTLKFQVEESFFQDDVTVPLWYNTLFLSVPKDMFTQFLNKCFESGLLSVCLSPYCLSALCTVRIALHLAETKKLALSSFPSSCSECVDITVQQNAVQVGSALHVSVPLAAFAKQPVTNVLISCTLQISKWITCLHEQD